jgi:hypothetical protein
LERRHCLKWKLKPVANELLLEEKRGRQRSKKNMCGRIMGLASMFKQTQTNAKSSSRKKKEKATNENYGEVRIFFLLHLDFFSLFLERVH